MKRDVVGAGSEGGKGARARLSCGHDHPAGDAGEPGTVASDSTVDCPRCDRLEWPEGLEAYNRTPTFTEQTVPEALLENHHTKSGVWARIHVEQGRLEYTREEPERSVEILEPGAFGTVLPEARHRVRPLGAVSFHVQFWRRPRR